MENFVVPISPSPANPKPNLRSRWKRSLVELTGKIDSKYCHDVSALFMSSYSQVGAFPHSYHVDGVPCETHVSWFMGGQYLDNLPGLRKQGISGLEFDSKVNVVP